MSISSKLPVCLVLPPEFERRGWTILQNAIVFWLNAAIALGRLTKEKPVTRVSLIVKILPGKKPDFTPPMT